MKISYTGDTTIYSTSESATSTAGALVVYGGVDKREGEYKRQYGRVELFCGGVGVSNLVSVQAIPVYTSSASTTEVLDQIR
jgi:hypothetical protein